MSGNERAVVLLVDDEPVNRALITAYLGTLYRIVEAASGREALEILEREPVDLVLLDVMMPGQSGYDVCKAIKARADRDFLPVVLLTALTAQEDRNIGLAAGADDFLTKPVDRVELKLRCRALLELRRQDRRIRAQLEDLRRLQALKDDLLVLIVHDLRNPLVGIEGNLELLQRWLASGDDRVKRALGRMATTAEQLRSILDGILDLRLLEDGEFAVKREPVEVSKLVAAAIATLEGAGEAGRVPIRYKVAGELVAPLDPRLVRRALENLIGNALKYSPPGEPVEVLVRPEGERISFEVCDRGPGVPDEFKSAIFQKYETVEQKVGKGRRGYGLGLHLVKLVARAHDGDVSVRDAPEGRGSVFCMSVAAGGGGSATAA